VVSIAVLFESTTGLVRVGVLGLRTIAGVTKIIVDAVEIRDVGLADKLATLVDGFQDVIVIDPVPKLVDVIPTCTSTVPAVVTLSVDGFELPAEGVAVVPVTVIEPVVIAGDAREVCTAPTAAAEAPEAAEGAEYTLLFVVIVIGFTEPGENPEKVAEYGVDV
jgi:hypothetical protein